MQPFIQTPVQAVTFQTIDVRFHCRVLMSEILKRPILLKWIWLQASSAAQIPSFFINSMLLFDFFAFLPLYNRPSAGFRSSINYKAKKNLLKE
jgi:uncharacterized membrane protein